MTLNTLPNPPQYIEHRNPIMVFLNVREYYIIDIPEKVLKKKLLE